MREQLGLTQAQLASAFGVSRNALAHAEAGNSMLDGRAAQRFAQMLAASQQALAAVQQPQAEMPEGEITHLMALRKHKLTALQAQLHTIHTRAQQATQLLHTAATLASGADRRNGVPSREKVTAKRCPAAMFIAAANTGP